MQAAYIETDTTGCAMKRSAIVCGLLMLLALSGLARAATYTGFDCPDAIHTEARGINDRGDIVGVCEDANGIHGFRLRKGEFKLVDFPGATQTVAGGINNLGHIAGWYADGPAALGFVFRNGRFETINRPGSELTFVHDIDDLGRIVGAYQLPDGNFRGFIRDSKGYRDIAVPKAISTAAFARNILGQVAGGFINADGAHRGFIRKNGKFQSILPPEAVGARALGINVLGHVVGGWTSDPDCPNCFVNAFILTPKGYRILKFPGAHETVAQGINTEGQIVGHYYGVDERFHGFVREP
jgi:uncharacterized membrane protein